MCHYQHLFYKPRTFLVQQKHHGNTKKGREERQVDRIHEFWLKFWANQRIILMEQSGIRLSLINTSVWFKILYLFLSTMTTVLNNTMYKIIVELGTLHALSCFLIALSLKHSTVRLDSFYLSFPPTFHSASSFLSISDANGVFSTLFFNSGFLKTW